MFIAHGLSICIATCENKCLHPRLHSTHLVHLHTGGVGEEAEVLTDSLSDLVQVGGKKGRGGEE